MFFSFMTVALLAVYPVQQWDVSASDIAGGTRIQARKTAKNAES
jgi:hypothetical protein